MCACIATNGTIETSQTNGKMTGETREVCSDKRKQREERGKREKWREKERKREKKREK